MRFIKMYVFISGCSRGIGYELASQLLIQGHYVIAGVRNLAKAPQMKILAQEYSSHCEMIALDVESSESIQRAVSQIKAPQIDVLINNAGVLLDSKSDLMDLDLLDVERSFQVNVLGPIELTRTCLNLLKKSSQPLVVNTSSVMGSFNEETGGRAYAYRITKCALNMFTKLLAQDEAWLNVISLHPGWVQTDMGGPNALISPPESASSIIKLIENIKPQDRAKFIAFDGRELKW